MKAHSAAKYRGKTLNGAELLINRLKVAEVKTIFVYPGASILPVLDVLSRDKSIKTILTASEQGAVFAAEGYAKASGKTGVVLTTGGPGATNLVTGIADAFMDSVPLVLVTGNVALSKLGHDSFQEVDIYDVAMPITKYGYIVKTASELGNAVDEAFVVATDGRKGPVLIDIPENIFTQPSDFIFTLPRRKIHADDLSHLNEVIQLIDGAMRPLVYFGGGLIASGAEEQLKEFAHKINAPVACSMMGIGGFPSDDELYIGVASDNNPIPKQALSECDLLITAGARFASKATDNRYKYAPHLKLVHLDIDRAELDKNLSPDAYLLTDLKTSLSIINQRVSAKNKKWFNNKTIEQNKSLPFHFEVLKSLNCLLGNNTIVTTDVGNHQLWAMDQLKFGSPRTFLSSGGLGAMGFGLGGAIGASLATGKHVVCVSGDGSFTMNMNELATAIRYNIPVTVLVFDNGSLGMIRKKQKSEYKRRYFCSTLGRRTDYAAIAEGFGAKGFTLKRGDDIDRVLKSAFSNTPSVVRVIIDIDTF